MTLQVIGAGMPRTGTLSLKTPLEQLGFGPCHHMTEVFARPEQWPFWNRVGDGDTIDWEEIKSHNEAVRREAAPGRLLVYRVSEGWEPLCAFRFRGRRSHT